LIVVVRLGASQEVRRHTKKTLSTWTAESQRGGGKRSEREGDEKISKRLQTQFLKKVKTKKKKHPPLRETEGGGFEVGYALNPYYSTPAGGETPYFQGSDGRCELRL